MAWDKERVDRYWSGLIPIVGEEDGFRTYPCESCGQPYHGDRHHVHWYHHDKGPSIHGRSTVCTDCAHYLAYSIVPDEA